MTTIEFNSKWSKHLEKGCYGLAIGDPRVIDYVDSVFEKLSKDQPGFTYSQIKMKFNYARVYIEGIPEDSRIDLEIEDRINAIMK